MQKKGASAFAEAVAVAAGVVAVGAVDEGTLALECKKVAFYVACVDELKVEKAEYKLQVTAHLAQLEVLQSRYDTLYSDHEKSLKVILALKEAAAEVTKEAETLRVESALALKKQKKARRAADADAQSMSEKSSDLQGQLDRERAAHDKVAASKATSEPTEVKERQPGRRGCAASEERATKKVELVLATLNYKYETFFKNSKIYNFTDFKIAMWHHKVMHDNMERSPAQDYTQKTEATNQAKAVVTLLSIKDTHWAKKWTVAEGDAAVHNVVLKPFFDVFCTTTFSGPSGGGERRWQVCELLWPGAFDTEAEARKNNSWSAAGKHVTAANKLHSMYKLWVEDGKQQTTDAEKLDMVAKYNAVLRPNPKDKK